MSNGAPPGSTGTNPRSASVDAGTLARTSSPTPDSVGITGGRRTPAPAASETTAAVGVRNLTAALLDAYLGKHIDKVCGNGFTDNGDNHCAHFVSHVLGLEFGLTCRTMGSPNARGPEANIRVQQLFHRCPKVGEWASLPSELKSGLVFITKASNVDLASKVMANVPRKHVGIFIGGSIWHYSNGKRKVVKQTPDQFALHYPAPYNAMFYGSFP
jgi:hypothetical protein